MTFKDHFSHVAVDYAKYRPDYPPELFQYLSTLPPQREHAWDVGTGNGQAALGLAPWFERVTASDPSAEQIRQASLHPKVRYAVAPAERTDLADASVDLITVAQALHWFDFERFYKEARRVLKPQGVIAAWTYGLCSVTPAVDVVVRGYYTDVVGSYWPPERRYVDERYETIPFPFVKLEAPAFGIRAQWSLEDFRGYLETWSAARGYRQAQGSDPRDRIDDALRAAWGTSASHEMVWPLYLRVGCLS